MWAGQILSSRVVVAAALAFGAAALAGCGQDDGRTVRNLNSESPIPSGGSEPAGSTSP